MKKAERQRNDVFAQWCRRRLLSVLWTARRSNHMGREVGGGSGLGTHVHPLWIHVDVWQNQYNIAK